MARPVKPLNKLIADTTPLQGAFGIALRELRIAKGLMQSDLEGEGEMDRSTVSKLEAGKHQVCLKGIFHLANKLGITPGELMDEVQRILPTQPT